MAVPDKIRNKLESNNCERVGSFHMETMHKTSSVIWLYDENEIIISGPDNWKTMSLDEFNRKAPMTTNFGTYDNCEQLGIKYS